MLSGEWAAILPKKKSRLESLPFNGARMYGLSVSRMRQCQFGPSGCHHASSSARNVRPTTQSGFGQTIYAPRHPWCPGGWSGWSSQTHPSAHEHSRTCAHFVRSRSRGSSTRGRVRDAGTGCQAKGEATGETGECFGPGARGRTEMPVRANDFESFASASSATPGRRPIVQQRSGCALATSTIARVQARTARPTTGGPRQWR